MEQIRWEVGGIVPEDKVASLSEAENAYFDNYSAILGEYMSDLNLDLTSVRPSFSQEFFS